MRREHFIRSLALLPLVQSTMKLSALNRITESFENTEQMPVLFVGHGNPMNAIEDNVFSRGMKEAAKNLRKPKAILMVSAHWETKGTHVTIQEQPPTIHDFYGFPKALFDAQYPAPGSKWLAEETRKAVKKTTVEFDDQWGLDHGCWSVTKNMFPGADVPVIELSLDQTQPAQYHYELAKELASLRHKGVLIIGSGNMVHNLGMVKLPGGDFNAPYGFDWATEANEKFKKYISDGDHQPLINYSLLGKAVQLAIPTPEHYLPMLYALALQEKNEKISLFNDVPVAGSITMTSFKIDKV